MRSIKKIWLGIGTLVGLLAVGQVVAQHQQDFPNLKGGNLRLGRNGDPDASGPGPANLRWYATNAAASNGTRLIVDNTDTNPPFVHPTLNQYQTNLNGFVANAGVWDVATDTFVDDENIVAEDAYLLQVRARPEPPLGRNTTIRPQYYLYSNATASRSGGPQTEAQDPTLRRTFTWNFTPPTNTAGQYALYVHLPIQPTRIGNVRVFPQRYYVYQIRFGTNQTRTEIVDTYASGGGWVRLGAGGQPTGAVFGYNGTNPIQITLVNTIPRNNQGQLMLPNGVAPNERLLSYADAAMAVPQPGSYAATPTSARLVNTDINSTVVTGASNERETGIDVETGDPTSSTNSVVTNYEYQNGNVRWRYSPAAETGAAVAQDDDQAVFAGAGAWLEDPTYPRVAGDGARTTPVQLNDAPATWTDATYTFNVPGSGSYAVYAYIPPTVPGTPLAHGATYEVLTTQPDGTVDSEVVIVDQSARSGWVRIGTRYAHDTFQNNPTDVARPIRVRVINHSDDPTDNARSVYIDAIRVVGETSLAVTSTPVHADAYVRIGPGDPVLTKVVFIADESGRIHCLDADGNGDGTTRVYWTYPSVRDAANYDPNLGPVTPGNAVVAGEDWSGPGNTPPADRSPTAEMPSGFELSTAVVQRRDVGGDPRDFLYIASSNGRVYCIDVAGRGDNTGAADPVSGAVRTIGTTTRVWTYPSTYPSANAVTTSSLGPFRGSLLIDGNVVYAPSSQGRLYALNALGNTDKSTTVNWSFPALTDPTLGAINGTPSIEFGRIYFGTMRKLSATEDIPGRIYALNPDGSLLWNFQRTGGPEDGALTRRTDDFRSSVITVPGAQLGGADGNTVFALNENRVLYSLNADTGNINWVNDELQTGATGSLGFTQMLAFDNNGNQSTVSPVILVPGSNGQFSALFANSNNLNVAQGRLAWGYVAAGDSIDASMSVSNGWMYGADTRGYLYAWSTGLGISIGGDGPGPVIPPNDPRGNVMRKAKIRLINRDTYRALRLPEDATAKYTYGQAVGSGAPERNVLEWGETAYVLVYDFPYIIDDPNGDPVDPPIVNISFNADGRTVRGVSVQSRNFDKPSDADETVPNYNDVAPVGPMIGVDDNPRLNGYAVLAFPLQNGGANAVPPGAGEISFNIQTGGLATGGALSTVAVSPNIGPRTDGQAWSRIPFRVANPIAIVVPGPGAGPNDPLTVQPVYSLGMTNDPSASATVAELREEALMNGSTDVAGGTKRQSKMTTATNVANHGGRGRTKIWVYDRSFMGLLRPGGNFGLDNIRIDRRDLSRQGGEAGVFKRFDPTYYAGFEDLPVQNPNISADYPDVRSEQIRVTKDPNGSAENPIFSGVALRAPRINVNNDPSDLVANTPLTEATLPGQRLFIPTEFEISVDIPRFQPPALREFLNNTGGLVPGSDGSFYRQGHIGRIQVFVDSLSNGQLDMAQREAYRSFNLTTSIAIDERLRVTTPTVDLGTLPTGTGYSPAEDRSTLVNARRFSPLTPLANNRGFMHPWGGSAFSEAYKPFGVVNEGNVNLLNLRAATRSTLGFAGAELPLSIDSTGNDPLSWLNGYLNVHTSLDYRYSPGPEGANRPVALQKPRVSDRLPTALSPNAKRRQNANIQVFEGPQNTLTDPENAGGLRFPVGNPKVGISVPIGFPVGKYATRLVIFEDSLGLDVNNGDHGQTRFAHQPGGFPTAYAMDPFWKLRPRVRFNDIFGAVPNGTPEAATEPGILLTFNVAESRLTNSFTPKTATMIDDLAPTGGDRNLRFQNAQPAATRDANGNLIVAWASNRTGFGATPAPDGSDFNNRSTRLFFSSLDSGASFSGTSYSVNGQSAATNSFLRDLGHWVPASNAQWFRQEMGNYPTSAPANYFGAGTDANTARFGSPAFPTGGYQNPFTGGGLSNAKMAFVGRASRATSTGVVEESRLFLTSVTANENGALTVPEPLVMPHDVQVAKSEPSVMQTSDTEALLFYTGTTAGQNWAYYSRFDPDLPNTPFRPASPIPFGRGFLTTGGVSATGRMFRAVPRLQDQYPIAEVLFTGQLRGRPYPETFLGRVRLETNGGALAFPEKADGTLQDQIFSYLPQQTRELVQRESASLFRARGIAWQRNASSAAIELYQRVNNVPMDLLVPNTRTADQETGLISFESRLGGRVIFDPAQGTIRFTAAAPTGSAQIFLTYTPRFLRVSETSNQGGGAYKTTAMFDERMVSDTLYWRRSSGGFVGGDSIRNDRLVMMWNRAAGGNVTARPFLSSLRFGADLSYRLPTLPDGTPGYVDRTGATRPAVLSVTDMMGNPVGPYQVDAANGRIYFQSEFEGGAVIVRHTAIDDNGNLILNTAGNDAEVFPNTVTISYVHERTQEPVPIETAVNESGLTAFLDPFSYAADRRPPLVWLFWTSTRGGVSDIYFETIAPQWTPTVIAK
jgi:hypothetical protein